MAILSGICKSFKLECFQGVHDFRVDTIKVAAYSSLASLSPDTTAYTSSHEVTDTNFPAGGKQLVVSGGYPAIYTVTGNAVVKFDDLTVTPVTMTFRALLLYNASKANRAIAVYDRGVDVILAAGPLQILNNGFQPYLLTFA